MALSVLVFMSIIALTVGQYDYGLMLDAGSSGTRLSLFQWYWHLLCQF